MDERTSPRLVVDKTFDCIVGQHRYPVFVYDISQNGCMFVAPQRGLSPGDCILMQFSEQIEAAGRVIWALCGNIGLKFDVPIHEAAVRHFGFAPRPESFEDWEPHDRFGRPLPQLQMVVDFSGGRRSCL